MLAQRFSPGKMVKAQREKGDGRRASSVLRSRTVFASERQRLRFRRKFSNPAQKRMASTGKQVHSVSFDFLYIEMVDYVIKSSSSPEAVLFKLEQIGFRVGQRLVER